MCLPPPLFPASLAEDEDRQVGPVDVGHGDLPGEVSQGSHPSGPGKVLAERGPASEPGHREWPLHVSAGVCSEQHPDCRGSKPAPRL
ncbi:unnamed protein product [Rangifer tarandus platyrhynchus]|uniref:Uncharacterized protein n=1 Tax=Rangifer tarandus platyrhynchus TaxID=3082113 RepID=A0AC59Z2Q7_RANTA